MQITSWNVFRRNMEALYGVKELVDAGHDILCLQEVPELLLEDILQLMPYNYTCLESVWRNGRSKSYLVILSNYPIEMPTTVPHKQWPSLRNELHGQTESFEFQQINIMCNGQQWRIFNVHLPLNVSPFSRIREWLRIHRRFSSSSHNIICGDFNAFADPLWNMLVAPFFGYRPKDVFIHERNELRNFIFRKKLINPFGRWRTQMHLPFQLDFILHPKLVTGTNAIRWPSRMGSDHWPISIKLKKS